MKLKISEAEWQIMKVIWRRFPCTAQAVVDALEEVWTATTVKTFLNRLHRKGALRFEKAGKTYVYFPAVTEQECCAAATESFLQRVFDGSLSPMLLHFVNSRDLAPEELDKLEKILREKRNSHDGVSD